MNNKRFQIIAFFAFIIVVSCSTKKNRFINREYHAMTTKFNVLYNGELAFQKGLSEINEKYEDNYWNVLPIEPLEIKEEVVEVSFQKNKGRNTGEVSEKETDKNQTSFGLAEEKAVKAIQKHSMLIKNVQRNRQIDEAYVLLGKSRYYSQRFVPALEAFTFITKNYPEASLIGETTVWKAKANIRMQNEEDAVTSLEILLRKEDVSDAIKEDAHTALAIAFKQLEDVPQVIRHLVKAVEISKNVQKKSRNLFVLGQLYRQEGSIKLSQEAFQHLIKFKRAPYKYRLHAEIEKAKNFQKEDNALPLIEKLQKLIKNRENRPYLDELYYQLAIVEGSQGMRELQIENYKKSIHTKQAKEFQKGLSFEGLGNLYFKETDYVNAGAYYDSVLQVSGKLNTKRIRRLKRKRESLEEVLVLEGILKRNDSLWSIISLDEKDQRFYYESYIASLKEKEALAEKEIAFQNKLKQYQNSGNANAVSGLPANGGTSNSKQSKWYFYNVQASGYGEQEFVKLWGTRKLKDNWRWSDDSKVNIGKVVKEFVVEKNKKPKALKEKYKVSYYLKQLPITQKELDSISELRSTSYYQLGVIYKEQFKELLLAAEKLEKLIEFFPENKLLLAANYQLYKIYLELKDSRAEKYKNVILNQYPESIFAQFILNPKEINNAENGKISPEKRYKEIYLLYKSEAYIQTVDEISNALRIFEGAEIVPKLELLKAYALAKIKGKEAFQKALKYVVLNYANTEEGKKAKELLSEIK